MPYSLQILLPDDLETRLKTWAAHTPGATWPAWGGHVTLLPRFDLTCDLAQFEARVRQIVAEFQPFRLQLNRAVCVAHVRRPGLKTVLLVNRSTGEPEALFSLRNRLAAHLASLKCDIDPELIGWTYKPHLTLTLGLPDQAALNLAEAVQASRLAVTFTIRQIWLLCLANQVGERISAFDLADPMRAIENR